MNINTFTQNIQCGLCYAKHLQSGLEPEFIGLIAITRTRRYNLERCDNVAK